jgi:hypothetical protein
MTSEPSEFVMLNNTQVLLDYVQALANQDFWGTLTLKFQHGQIIHVVKEESLKPDQLIPDHRRNYDHIDR